MNSTYWINELARRRLQYHIQLDNARRPRLDAAIKDLELVYGNLDAPQDALFEGFSVLGILSAATTGLRLMQIDYASTTLVSDKEFAQGINDAILWLEWVEEHFEEPDLRFFGFRDTRGCTAREILALCIKLLQRLRVDWVAARKRESQKFARECRKERRASQWAGHSQVLN